MAQPYTFLKKIPNRISDIEVQQLIHTSDINSNYLMRLKDYAASRDEWISRWLNISIRTLQKYKQPDYELKPNIQEKLILLFALFKHGIDVFGSKEKFNHWLDLPNFHFDDRPPIDFLNTVTGIRYVDSRLTAMEFGDNV